MIDVKSKSLIEFELSISKEQNQEVVLAKYDFDKEFCSLKPEHLQIHFTNQNDQLISKNTLKNQLRILSKLFISHPQITFKWLDCYDQDATEALDFHHLVHDFAFDIFLLENVIINEHCFHALGNLKLAMHLVNFEGKLVTPEGTYNDTELNENFQNFHFHDSWDWLMPTWPKLRQIAHQHDLLMNKQIDETFGVSVQIFESNGRLTQFEEEKFSGIRSLWSTFIKYIDWFEKKIEKRS